MSTAYHHRPARLLAEPEPPPIIVRVAKKNVAQPLIQVASKKRVCDCCKKSVPRDSIKCPFCKEWRKDIKKHVVTARGAFATASVCFLVIFLTFFASWPRGKYIHRGLGSMLLTSDREYFKKFPWHNEVLDEPKKTPFKPSSNHMMNGVLSMLDIAMDNPGEKRYRWQFSANKFIASPSGWLLIASSVFSVMVVSVGCSNISALRRKGYRKI